MNTGEAAGRQADSWSPSHHAEAPVRVRRGIRARADEERAKSARIAIASSLFLLFLAAALLIGGHATIDPLLRSAFAVRDANGTGDLVFTMPDGIFCRHMSFDNVTAEITEGAIERCPKPGKGGSPKATGFGWGAH
jgi:hypothetical protein